MTEQPPPADPSDLIKRRWGVFGGGRHGTVVLAVMGAIALGGGEDAARGTPGQSAADGQEPPAASSQVDGTHPG
jgi:hypothetical protein